MREKVPKKILDICKSRSEMDVSQLPICEVIASRGCNGIATDFHHRQMRSQGGGHHVVNCLMACRFCHNAIHADPSTSYEHGWLVHGWDDPAKIVVLRRGHWVQLREDGSFVGVKF